MVVSTGRALVRDRARGRLRRERRAPRHARRRRLRVGRGRAAARARRGGLDLLRRVDGPVRLARDGTAAQAGGRKILSPYITAGDPTAESTVSLMHALVGAGADILEVGIPFSDPMAEGPVIQAAMERSLAQGMTCHGVLDIIAQFRQQDKDTPVVLMGYLNPIEMFGYEAFAKRAAEAGVDGTILVDLPPEESHEVVKCWQQHNIKNIFLCSPTTDAERMPLLNQVGSGYLYYVSLKGVTGASQADLAVVKQQYLQRKAQIKLPLLIGFGIKNATMAAEIAQFADGVVVGAALIERLIDAYQQHGDYIQSGAALIRDMRQAMDNT